MDRYRKTLSLLREDTRFQEAFARVLPNLEDVLLELQRVKAVSLREDKEELGRQIIVISDVMAIFDGLLKHEVTTKKETRKLNRANR